MIGVFVGGIYFHLRLHPLRHFFAEAYDFLRQQPLVVITLLLLSFCHYLVHPPLPPQTLQYPEAYSLMQATDFTVITPRLVTQAAASFARHQHQLFPSSLLVYLLPLLVSVALLHLSKHPYRAGLKSKLAAHEVAAFGILFVLSCGYTLVQLTQPMESFSEAGIAVLTGLGMLAQACMITATQAWLLRLIINWKSLSLQPQSASLLQRSWWNALGRWRPLLLLVVFNLVWLIIFEFHHQKTPRLMQIMTIEALIFFSPLPLAIAAAPADSGFLDGGAAAMFMLKKIWLKLLAFSLTCITLLAVLHFTSLMLLTLLTDSWLSEVLACFLVASMHSMVFAWLMVTTTLFLFEHHHAHAPEDQPL